MKKSLTCISVTTALLLGQSVGVAVAQETSAPQDVEQIEVRGIRGSMIKAQAIKQDNSSIVEAITSEDIGKLPDVSIAESLSRLPGLSGQRVNGRSQVVSIRGLSPDFSNTLLNGRQLVSTGDNRSVEYDQYPSELLSGATVYKTPDASLIGQGIAGTVDMQTIRPLGHGKRDFIINGKYEWNEYGSLNPDADDDGYRTTVAYIDQFMDDTLGFSIGVSLSDITTQSERDGYWGGLFAAGRNNVPLNDGNNSAIPDADALLLTGIKPFMQSNNLIRNSMMATVEYRPTSNLSSTLDLFYSDFREDILWRGVEAQLYGEGASLEPGYLLENGVITQGTINTPYSVVHTKLDEKDSKLYAIGWNLEGMVTDDLTLSLDVSYSKADRSDWNSQLQYYSTASDRTAVSFALDPEGHQLATDTDYTDLSTLALGNPMGWGSEYVDGGHLGDTMNPHVVDDMLQMKFEGEYYVDFGMINQLDFGINVDSRAKDKNHEQWSFALGEGQDLSLPDDSFLMSYSYSGLGDFYALDPDTIYSDQYEWVNAQSPDLTTRTWRVEEDITTLYLMGHISSGNITGNVGVQYVYVDQVSNANSASTVNGEFVTVPVEEGATYSNILPSLNLNWELENNNFVRLGVARTVSRPRMDDMRATSTYGLDETNIGGDSLANTPWSASGGNATLRPWEADAVDLSFEHYFQDTSGYASVALFYKDLKSYIYKQEVITDFSGYPTGGLDPQYFEGFTTTPTNGEGGKIKGVEVTVSLDGEMFTDALSGYGAMLTGSYTDSEIQPNGPDSKASALPGLSKNVYSGTLYYDKEGFSARVAVRHRSAFVGELPNFAAQRTLRQMEAETLVDAQISYAFDSGSLEGLTLIAQGSNLTDEPYVSTTNNNDLSIVDYFSYGRTFSVAASYSFF